MNKIKEEYAVLLDGRPGTIISRVMNRGVLVSILVRMENRFESKLIRIAGDDIQRRIVWQPLVPLYNKRLLDEIISIQPLFKRHDWVKTAEWGIGMVVEVDCARKCCKVKMLTGEYSDSVLTWDFDAIKLCEKPEIRNGQLYQRNNIRRMRRDRGIKFGLLD
jgi:hypothetical protein